MNNSFSMNSERGTINNMKNINTEGKKVKFVFDTCHMSGGS